MPCWKYPEGHKEDSTLLLLDTSIERVKNVFYTFLYIPTFLISFCEYLSNRSTWISSNYVLHPRTNKYYCVKKRNCWCQRISWWYQQSFCIYTSKNFKRESIWKQRLALAFYPSHCIAFSNEFAKLRALARYAPWYLTCLCAFVRYVPLGRMYLTHAPYLCALHTLFVRVKIALGWICSPAKTFHFP